MHVYDRKPQTPRASSSAALTAARASRRDPLRAAIVAPPRTEMPLAGGEPLDHATLAWSRRAFDHDFSSVRLHRTAAAAQAASQRGASAFAVGDHVYFGGPGRDLSGREGRGLLAHELTHVLQQQRRGRIDESRVEPVDSPAEREAHHAAARVMAGDRAPALRHAPVGVPRDVGWARRGPIADPYGEGLNDALKGGGGDFAVTRYDIFDGDLGKDTSKQCGVDITIKFTPAKSLRSDQISFVQIQKPEKGGTSYLFPHMKPRATTAAQGDEGWAIDQLAGQKNADYTIANDGKEREAWGQLGYRKSATDFRDATLIDEVRLNREPGQTIKLQATSFALDKTNSKYLGGVAWGYDVDSKGVVTKKPFALQSAGAPSGIQKSALEGWNAQAKNPDLSKRNAPDQIEITVP